MKLIRVADASVLPTPLPDVDGFGFYIGGNTPHVWTATEIATLKKNFRYLVPIFTRSDPNTTFMHVDAGNIIHACDQIGLPLGDKVVVDMEDAVDTLYVQFVDSQIVEAGFKMVIYGQHSTILRNPKPSGGYWVADWDGVANDDPSWAGKQYTDTGPWDLSEMDPTDVWDLQSPAPADTTSEDEMANSFKDSQQSNNGVALIAFPAGADTTVEFGTDPKFLMAKPTFTASLMMGSGKTPWVLTGNSPVTLDQTGTYVLRIPADLVPFARLICVVCSDRAVPFAVYLQ